MNLHLTSENKVDVASALIAAAGMGVAVAASELSLPALMVGGVVIVGGIAVYRVVTFRGKLRQHEKEEQVVRTGTQG